MDTQSLFLSILAFITVGLIVYYQYYHQQKVTRDIIILSVLRFLAIFAVFILLINPKIEQRKRSSYKPKLILGIDNSASISSADSQLRIKELKKLFISDKELNDRFELSDFIFGSTVTTDTVLNFDDPSTDIYNAIEVLNTFTAENRAPVVMITDGNQTYGRDYTFMSSKNPIFPIAIGDTLQRPDIEISRINVNAYATLDNNFPVEIFINSNTSKAVKSMLIIEKNGVELFSQDLDFSNEKKSSSVSFYLPADAIGMQLYTATLIPLQGEIELTNNTEIFGIDVLNEQTEIAIIYKLLHPDLGMIKRTIEANKQRTVHLVQINDMKERMDDFSIYILYQPEAAFDKLFSYLEKKEANYFIISGTQTDWNYLNKVQNGFFNSTSGLDESIFPVYQNDFNLFYAENIGFDAFPPLKGDLGDIQFNVQHEVLLSQQINNVKTGAPLLATYTNNVYKRVVLFGENIWKWRSYSFDAHQSFEKFDFFFNGLIQYIQLTEEDKRMDLYYDPVYFQNQSIRIQAKNYDSNRNVKMNSRLTLKINDSLDEIPFYLKNSTYEVQISNLKPGTYGFQVHDQDSNRKSSGSFAVLPFSMEQESQMVNIDDLEQLALQSEGRLYYEDQFNDLKRELLDNDQFRTLEKEHIKLISLIDWQWLLGLIVLSLSLEWLLRKYRGMI